MIGHKTEVGIIPQCFKDKVPKVHFFVTLTFDPVTKNQKDSSSHDGGLMYEV